MYNTYNDLPKGEIKERVAQYCYDYFFHYLLIESDLIRLKFCRFMSCDDTIQETFVENSETYKPHYDGKKLVMDLVIRDDKGRYYNFEMQNYDIESDDEVRFARYLDRLFDKQERKGIGYDEMKDVYQLIFYTGKPLNNFEHYQHILKRGDFDYGAVLEHQKAHATLLQLRNMEVDLNMEIGLSEINQLAYLLMYGKEHENSEMSKEVKEAIEIHNKYMETDAIIKGYELERERMIIKSKMNRAKKVGIEEGRKSERYYSVLELIKVFYGIETVMWLEKCSYVQLKKAFQLISKQLSYEEFKEEMLK